MASSSLVILLSVVLYVSAAENDNQAICIMLGCGNGGGMVDLCKKYMCNTARQTSPMAQPTDIQIPPQDMGYPFYQQLPFMFDGSMPPVPQNIDIGTSLQYLIGWPGWGLYLQQKDLNAWKQTVERIKNETDIRAKNWVAQLDNWYKGHKEVQTLINQISGNINVHMGAYDDLLNFLASHQVPVPFFNWLKDHFVFHPPLPQFMPHQIPDIHFPPPMPPMMPPNIDQFGFIIPGIPGQVDQTKPTLPVPPSQRICPTSNNCGSVNVTFDVRVGNVTHCSAFVKDPRQKLKNLLILASHSHKCLTFTTTQRTPTARSTSGEFLYSVDGITETMQHKWIIYLKSSKKHADLNNYWPSDGDYFIIDYVDANTLQNMKK